MLLLRLKYEMDYVTVATVVALVCSGAALCFWPMSLKIRAIKEELRLAIRTREVFQEEAKNQASSAQRVIDLEREMASLEDLPAVERLNRLLNIYGNKEKPSSRET